MFEWILPEGCRSAELGSVAAPDGRGADGESEAAGRPDAAEGLPAAEAELVARAVPKRRLEFAEGRACARQALAQFGVPAGPILRGPEGEPIWPDGFVGSITHTGGYRAAAVAPVSLLAAIGIDAEPNEPIAEGLIARLSSPGELASLRADAAGGAPAIAVHRSRLLFCAKEATYKAHFARYGEKLQSGQLSVRISAGRPMPEGLPAGEARVAGLLSVAVDGSAAGAIGTIERPGAPMTYSGRWCASAELLCAAIALPAA